MVFSKKQTEQAIDVIKLVNDIFYQGIDEGASDIHIEPQRDKVIVRYRIDGILRIIFEGELSIFEHMSSRIKILAGLEMTGLPKPQEGNIKFEHGERFVDLRISVLPTSVGDSIVIRILESNKNFGDYNELGLTPEQEKILNTVTRKPHGLLLVTGPNGSGKSTTLLTILNQLNSSEKSLVTLEDPVERKIDMVRQTNIDPSIGLTFADGLRYLLRQDPDIIMVGEIRDRETARIAIQAAVTGHLVLATIHTNNAAGAIVRLINMGIEPFLLASALKCVTAQRLARLNCPECREQYEPSKELIKLLNAPRDMKFFHSLGCEKCNQRGMIGRKGIHEIIQITRPIQDLILKKPTDEDISELAIKEGMITLRQAALQKVNKGLISIEEAIRLTEQ
ncbi:hypothetical protein A2331_00680 [Candidatus Falkowbacteria bacterium RIFOXYB2_FULL_34_18]|uniref:Bacterial type II secretion system protein E domain-containing protein n=1 Tax=Candidatus Falkowbacteria bacterium RIFOXYD2_FULL_34_120 TaxID=1798007 RepID=A0A1F5TM10_9BACT|nr:MAG: hypothetical protein A2331_00680 [Candidatus Falkowbacteria bacterium RIFOXYB2_FULL_34_18]OGF29204.1 MAG: hypothetical protein A2500_05995 [Candidatus Falkowbacteria bacterium RIFOXYC12_FULL_34_55]OGF37742.1 MAG: hypothetical protein A2466_06325 [Candidatus Falkowbacteria bacterium RIFOXYC2_FULL_34_220]OGF38726.1 MAG: hypothetical protein A2515_01660 [Candidatus Falkowbacteria bacterium RIFOXYD12_FULL_34_57]OGF39960.1 MAG: hypothetical protein A2531_01915 [Candidatus Falkowbacteria bact